MVQILGLSISEVLWKVSWQVAVMAAVMMLASIAARRAPARVRHAFWLLVLLKFLIPPVAYLPANLAFWQHQQSFVSRSAATAPLQPAVRPFQTEHPKALGSGVNATPLAAATAARTISMNDVFITLWLIGILTVAMVLLGRYARQRRLVRHSVAASDTFVQKLSLFCRDLSVWRLPEPRISTEIATPMLVGFVRPILLLPAGINELCSESQLQAILMHEVAHIKRCDLLVLWLYQFCQILFYFHPALWLAGRQLRKERELACDELVLSTESLSPKEYASGYVAALKLANGLAPLPVSLAMAEPLKAEKHRVERILSYSASRRPLVPALALLIIALIGLPTFAGVRSKPSSIAKKQSIDDLALVLSGTTPVKGSGIIVTLTDSNKHAPPSVEERIHDTDIRNVIEWVNLAGAEALSINGHRVMATSAVCGRGSVIYFDDVRLSPPYVIKAIGDAKTMQGALEMPGGAVSLFADPRMIIIKRNDHMVVDPSNETGDALVLAGMTTVSGRGIILTLQDSKEPGGFFQGKTICDTDIRNALNELKCAGATAISVNGQRLVATSAVIAVGPTIRINGNYLRSPFEIKAVGDSEKMKNVLQEDGFVSLFRYPDMGKIISMKRIEIEPYRINSKLRHGKPVVAACSLTQTSESLPSADFLSAALVEQLSKSGGSIAVDYDYTYDPSPGAEDSATMSFHYIRTSDALQLGQLGPGTVERIVDSFDRRSNEYRQLHVDHNGKSWGTISNRVSGLLDIQATIDPIYRWVGASPLFQAILRGTVSPGQESIDGHLCWRVEIPADPMAESEQPYKRYLVWLDPLIGFNPRKLEWIVKAELPKLPSLQISFLNYQNVGVGLWFPQRVEFAMTWLDGKVMKSTAKMKSLEAGKVRLADDVLVKFPSGTKVKDAIRQMEYTVP